MATAPKDKTTKRKSAKERTREIKEVSTKLKNMGPMGKAEVVSDVFERTFNRQVTGFVDFLREQSVVGLAIGLVIGTQVKQLVDSLVLNVITPITQLFLPGNTTLDKKFVMLHLGAHNAKITWGAFLLTLINFVLVMAVVYFVFKGLKLDKLFAKREELKPKKK